MKPSKIIPILLTTILGIASSVQAETGITITDFGATPNDATDDTAAIQAALAHAGETGGGLVRIPKGTFLVSRGRAGACILEVPSNTIVEGEGTASILKFTGGVNQSNFWRMIGSYRPVENVVIRDLALDGSTTFTTYVVGETPEQNHGVWFYAPEGKSKNITIANVYSHHFAGDCIALGRGTVGGVVRDCVFHDGIRQGIQIGAEGGANIQVLNNRELPDVSIQGAPRGIHLEHNTGVTNVLVSGNVLNGPILAGDGIDRLSIIGNTAQFIEGNINRNVLVANNQLRSNFNRAGVTLGKTSNIQVTGNLIVNTNSETFAAIYVWDNSEEKETNVVVTNNLIQSRGVAVAIAGMNGGLVSGNFAPQSQPHYRNHYGRSENIVVRNPLEIPIVESQWTDERALPGTPLTIHLKSDCLSLMKENCAPKTEAVYHRRQRGNPSFIMELAQKTFCL